MPRFLRLLFLTFYLCTPAFASEISITLTAAKAGNGVWQVARWTNATYFTITLNVTGDNVAASRKLPVTLDSNGKRSLAVVFVGPGRSEPRVALPVRVPLPHRRASAPYAEAVSLRAAVLRRSVPRVAEEFRRVQSLPGIAERVRDRLGRCRSARSCAPRGPA